MQQLICAAVISKPRYETDLVAEAVVKLYGNRVGNGSIVVPPEGNPEIALAEGRSVYKILREKRFTNTPIYKKRPPRS